jgi:hypothetical protein
MVKAKALQDKAPTQVGMFKHQPVPKEKLSKIERKKRAMEAQTKEKAASAGKKSTVTTSALVRDRSRDGTPMKKRTLEEPSYKGTSKPAPSSQAPTYRGTASLPARRGADDTRRRGQSSYGKRSRTNEYLGTDEEDEGDYTNDYDDYYSDESSDMEAGLNDMEDEEATTLATARREDEEEWRAEAAAKKAKMERRNKLAALAAKTRR